MKNILKIKDYKPLVFILAIAFIISIGTTFAYYYSEYVIPNKFKAMTYNVVLNTTFDGWTTNKVSISNNEQTNTAVVLRLNYNETWSKNENGALLLLSNMKNGQDVVVKSWTDTFRNNFVLQTDGWYYYKKTLQPQTTIEILNSLYIDTNIVSPDNPNDDYNNYDYNIGFNIEAIQATTKAVKSIWGKDIVISGDDITW